MQFIVPQFIDIEPKIIGPIGPKQLIILIVTAGLLFICFKLLNFILFIFVGLFILFSGITLAFVKVNGRPIYYLFLSFLQSSKRPSLRVWKRVVLPSYQSSLSKPKKEKKEAPSIKKEPLSSKRLEEISLIVDTGGEILLDNEKQEEK